MTSTVNTSWAMERYLPISLQVAVDKIPLEVLEESEHSLKTKLKSAMPREEFRLLEMLKVRLWDLYRASASDPKNRKNVISVDAWVSEFCSQQWYRKYVLKNEMAVAFIVSPPPQEFTRMKTMVNRAIERLAEVFELPLMKTDNRSGELIANTALISQMHAISKTLLERVHGGVIQRADIHTHSTSGALVSVTLPDTQKLSDMAAQLESLQKQLSAEDSTTVEGEVLDGEPEK